MTPFQEAWKATGRAEGGYVNNPNDSGGETNHGITYGTARSAGYTGSMKDMTAAQAEQIAKTAFWDTMRLDEIATLSTHIAREIFDTGFLTGPGTPSRFLQRMLNALNRQAVDYPDQTVDGKIGSATIAALAAFLKKRGAQGETVVLLGLNGLQYVFLLELVEKRVKDEEFFFGWVLQRVSME